MLILWMEPRSILVVTYISDLLFGVYAAIHPLDYKRRNQGLEKAMPIEIGDNMAWR